MVVGHGVREMVLVKEENTSSCNGGSHPQHGNNNSRDSTTSPSNRAHVQGYLAHKKQPPPLGPP